MRHRIIHIAILVTLLLLTSCYKHQSSPYIGNLHYGVNYNFIVTADSLALISQQPEEYLQGMMVDSFFVGKESPLVVADFKALPIDSIDTIWVQLATANSCHGWVRESLLHNSVVPDDPISQFVKALSKPAFHACLLLVVILLIIMLIRGRSRDLPLLYPVALLAAIFIAVVLSLTIHIYHPELWQEFYYHPTLNPFITPPLLCAFLLSLWAILILFIATVDDLCHFLFKKS